MRKIQNNIFSIDPLITIIFLILVFIGFISIFSTQIQDDVVFFSFNNEAFKQLIWIIFSFVILISVFFLEHRFIYNLAVPLYIFSILLFVIYVFTMIVINGQGVILNDVLKPYQKNRIESLINPSVDPLGTGWNIMQSKIAIGSGGFFGKGFLNGTQTRLDFVPEQSTDFIFSVVGEEFGFVGSLFLIFLYSLLLIRILQLAENQKDIFARVFGYSIFSVLTFHYMVNIAMTLGMFPVIGIPLPFISYGGSSLLSFCLLLFVFMKLNSVQASLLSR